MGEKNINTELLRRVKWLGIRLRNACYYKFSSLFGYTHEFVDQLADDLNNDLSYIIPELPCDTSVDLDKLSPLDLKKLAEWERKVGKITDELHSDDYYQDALNSYLADDQQALIEDIREVFHLDLIRRNKDYYHGVNPRKVNLGVVGVDFMEEVPAIDEWLNPDDYIDLILRIREEGLQPSEGCHAGTDENFRPVFLVDDKDETYGVLFFSMNPLKHGYPVYFGASADYFENLVYTPRLKIPMEIHLRSRRSCRQKMMGDPELTRILNYRDILDEKLKERKIEYHVYSGRNDY